jgi:hypothetical protein
MSCIVYVVRSLINGAVPESFHVIVTWPAGIDAPPAGDTNSTSARARGLRAMRVVRRAERSMMDGKEAQRRRR